MSRDIKCPLCPETEHVHQGLLGLDFRRRSCRNHTRGGQSKRQRRNAVSASENGDVDVQFLPAAAGLHHTTQTGGDVVKVGVGCGDPHDELVDVVVGRS